MVKDHLGNEFENTKQMIKHYNLNKNTYYTRLCRGWPLEKILTTEVETKYEVKPVTDHLGNEYATLKEMCEHYGTYPALFNKRKREGYSLEECLTRHPCKKQERQQKAIDHNGVVYESLDKMCEHYGITKTVYEYRMGHGWSLKKCLTKNVQKRSARDPFGNNFKDQSEMTKSYGIKNSTYNSRIKKGLSAEEALGAMPVINARTKDLKVDDHLLIESDTHNGRIRDGVYFACILDGKKMIMTHDEIVDYYRANNLIKKSTAKKPIRQVTDHRGNVFKTKKEMCDYWNVDYDKYRSRQHQGWTIEQCLTGSR